MKHNHGFLNIVDAQRSEVVELSIDDYLDDTSWHLVDVREDNEWHKAHFPNAVHLGKGVIERDVETHFPDKDTPLLLYCGGGFRSVLAAYNLQLMGYTKVASLIGGYRDWIQRSLPVES